MSKMGVGIIGCGAIGTVLARAIDEGKAGNAELIILYDIVREKAEVLANSLRKRPIVASSFKEVIENPRVQLVIEAASQDAVRQYAIEVLRSGKDLMVMSVGAFSDTALFEEVRRIAEETRRKVYIPSGAIVGIDGIKAASVVGIEELVLVTRKPPRALSDAPYLVEKGINLENIKEPVVVYEGPAREAAIKFPKNINVAMTLSIASIGPERTKVRIIADPTLDRNMHEIRARGPFGEIITIAKNVPSPSNPRTSYLAALSAIRTLRKITEPIVIGT
ncbi:MAG: aspartate dehydrogenase [Candidatus Baldrarchaeia archaeon]